MRKHGGTPSRRDKHVTLAANSPPGVARGRFVGGQQSGLAGCKPPPLFTRGASSCSLQGRRQGEPWSASPRPSATTYLPTYLMKCDDDGDDVNLRFHNVQKSARQGPGVATTLASATRKISALHPGAKQKFRMKLAYESPPLNLGPWHRRLNK